MGKSLKLEGQKFSRLLVVSRAENTKHRQSAWNCVCECGNTCTVIGSVLTSGATKSCGCLSNLKNLIGQKFGRLEVLSRLPAEKNTKPIWNCRCDCGNTHNVYGSHLVRGNVKSCGCLAKEVIGKCNKTHGLSDHRLYETWIKMVRRCSKPLDSGWENYGQRGIKVSESWLDFNNFISDMDQSYENGLTLERIDVNGNYCKENCKWLLHSLQAKNKRMYKTNKVGISGVNIITDKGIPTVQARVQSNLKRIRRTWSIDKYGEDEALRLASIWVKEKYLELDFGITHGVL